VIEVLFVIFIVEPYCELLDWAEGLGISLLRAVRRLFGEGEP
jgi:hypothetical protein